MRNWLTNGCALLVAAAVATTGCGGDDTGSSPAESAADAGDPAPTPTGDAPETTVAPTPTTLDEELVRLLAWCQGFHPGLVVDSGDDETDQQIMTEIAVDLDRNVPDEIADTWALYTDNSSDEITSEWRAAARRLDQYWVDECSPYFSLGTRVTQP